ncbi:olfactory receptor 5V1-like [Malurus melanocephalus]|uniref:olfactory receptor 5V1-like n=1 Tax=Malurus melanocephalus TaxID=175006 RepID=UPI002548841C|nr:olfactory receptor 5V1-like [Malurus melanocephalus]
MSNSSSISQFLLLPLADMRQLQLLHFCLLLGISLAALLASGLIISAVACGHHLAHMAAAAWASGFLTALLHTANTFSLPLCQSNALGQFFCEIPHILMLSCAHFREGP